MPAETVPDSAPDELLSVWEVLVARVWLRGEGSICAPEGSNCAPAWVAARLSALPPAPPTEPPPAAPPPAEAAAAAAAAAAGPDALRSMLVGQEGG